MDSTANTTEFEEELRDSIFGKDPEERKEEEKDEEKKKEEKKE